MPFTKGHKINVGRKHSEEHRRKISLSRYGYSPSAECRKKISKALTGRKLPQDHAEHIKAALPRGKDHHMWKGSGVGQASVHRYIEKLYGKPELCEGCGLDRKGVLEARKKRRRNPNFKGKVLFHWANKHGVYQRARRHWKRLCVSCHKIYDLQRKRKRRK